MHGCVCFTGYSNGRELACRPVYENKIGYYEGKKAYMHKNRYTILTTGILLYKFVSSTYKVGRSFDENIVLVFRAFKILNICC